MKLIKLNFTTFHYIGKKILMIIIHWIVISKRLKTEIKNTNQLKYNKLRFLVPLTVQFSNSFYENLHEIYNLREILMNEGILEYQPESPLFIDKVTNLTLPLRN